MQISQGNGDDVKEKGGKGVDAKVYYDENKEYLFGGEFIMKSGGIFVLIYLHYPNYNIVLMQICCCVFCIGLLEDLFWFIDHNMMIY